MPRSNEISWDSFAALIDSPAETSETSSSTEVERVPILSDDEFASLIESDIPAKPNALQSFVGMGLEGAANFADLGKLGLAMLDPGGTFIQDPRSSIGADWRGMAQNVLPPEQRGRGGFLSEDLPALGGQVIPGLAMSAIPGVGPAAASSYWSAQMGVPAFYDVLQKTGDGGKATEALIGNAAIAQLEKFGLGGQVGRVLGKLGKADRATGGALQKSILAQTVMGAGKEQASEVVQQGLSDALLEHLTDEDVAILENMLVVASDPAIATLGGFGGVAEGLVNRANARRAEQQQPAPGPSSSTTTIAPAREADAAPESDLGGGLGDVAAGAPIQPTDVAPPAPAPTGKTVAQVSEEAMAQQAARAAQGAPATQEPAPIPETVAPRLERIRAGKYDIPISRETHPDLKLYRGEPSDTTTPFRPGDGAGGPGTYFAIHRRKAEIFAGESGSVKEIDAPTARLLRVPANESVNARDWNSAARSLGYDGIWIEGQGEVVLFSAPGQASTQEAARAPQSAPEPTSPPEAPAAQAEPASPTEAPTQPGEAAAEAVKPAPAVDVTRTGLARPSAATGKLPGSTESGGGKASLSRDDRSKIEKRVRAIDARLVELGSKRQNIEGDKEKWRLEGEREALQERLGAEPPAAESAPKGVVEMMAGPPSPFGPSKPISTTRIRKAIRRWFTSPGHTPLDARLQVESIEQFTRAEIIEAARATKALDTAMSKAHGGAWRASPLAKAVDDAFEGDAKALASLPGEAQDAVAKMRSHADRLIRLQVKKGGVIDPDKLPEFAQRILESQGSYARRSYRAHMDPEWSDKVPADVRQRTFDLFRSWEEYAGVSDADIDAELDAILVKAKESADNPWQHLAAGKLGRKDLSIYKRRKDIPAELRAFLGEVEDPIANYANTVVKIAGVIARHEAYTNIKKQGAGKWLFEPGKSRPREFSAKLSAEGNKGLLPLDGLYTTPEIKKALMEVGPEDTGLIMRGLMRINSGIKWGKVIGQPWSFMRNLQSNVGLVVANGHLPGFFRSKEWKAAFGKDDLAEQKRLTRLGVVGGGISTAEWQDLRATLKLTPEEIVRGAKSPLTKAKQAAELAYEAADNAPKIRFFYAEEAHLLKAGYSAKRAEEIAADRTRDLMPTTERMAEVFKRFRRQPLVGAFFAFKAEIVRTTGNRLRLISQEIKSENDVVRAMGYRRAAGQILAATATPGLVYAWNSLNGIDADEDEDRRKFVPPWDEGSRLLWFGDETEGQYLDPSDVDPFSMLTEPLSAVLAGEDPEKAMTRWLRDEFDTFFGLSPTAELGVEMASGKDQYGRPIDDMAAHVWKRVQPGFVSSLERAGEKGVGGEAASIATGFRRYDFDVEKSLGYDIRGFAAQLSEATAKKNRQGKKKPEAAADFTAEMEKSRRDLFEEMSEKARAAIRLGVPERTVRKMLDDSLSKEVTRAVLLGNYLPHKDTKKD